MSEKNYIKSTRPMSKAEKVYLGLEVGCYILCGVTLVCTGLSSYNGDVGSAITSSLLFAALAISSQAISNIRRAERMFNVTKELMNEEKTLDENEQKQKRM